MTRRFILAFLILVVAPQAHAVDIQRVISPAGIEAWLVNDPSVPVISMDVAWRGGAITDGDGKEGLANMVSGLLDEGADDLDSQAFQRRLEDLAISIHFDAGYDYFGGELKTLTKNRDEAFRLFGMAITSPRFDAEPVERIRGQILAALARERENAGRTANQRWRALVFGDHPYGRSVRGSPDSVTTLTVADLRGFVAERLARDNLLITVAGDVDADELAPLLDRTFGALPEKSAEIAVATAVPSGGGQVVVVRRDIPQSVAVFGQEGLDRKHPDYPAGYLATYILGGGGFSARLTEEVREKRGLAYSVGAYMDPNLYGSLIRGSVGTANPRVAESLQLIRAEWKRIADQGVTEAELEDAKNAVIGSYLLRMTSTGGISGLLLGIRVYDLGIDYIKRREVQLRAVTTADIQRVARRLLDEGKLAVVVVGDPVGLEATVEEKG